MGDLSEQNRALVERVEPEYFGWQRAPDAILNRLLDAARTEGRGEGEPVAWQEAAEPFFRLAREVINPVNGERPWHADSKDWMVVFSFAGQSVTLGDLRRAAVASPIREPEISRLPKDAVERLLADHFGWRPYALMASDRSDLRGKIRDGYDYDINEPTRSDLSETADAILNLAPVGGRERSSQSQPVLSPKSDMETYGYNGERPEHDTEWKRGDVEKPVHDGWGERYLLTWCTRTATYDIGCIDGNWSVGETVETSPGELWRWLDVNPERHLPPERDADDGASSRHTGQLRDEPSSSNHNEESQTNGS